MKERDAYVEKLKAQLDQWNAEIARMEAKAHQAGADMRIKYQEQIRRLRQGQEEIRENLGKMQQTGGNAWKDLSEGLSKASNALREAFEKAWSHFK